MGMTGANLNFNEVAGLRESEPIRIPASLATRGNPRASGAGTFEVAPAADTFRQFLGGLNTPAPEDGLSAADDSTLFDIPGAGPPRKLVVLVAEDNATNQFVARRMVLRLGHDVELVANGIEAVEAVRRATFDVILMDLQMPVMDGYEASARIRESDAGRRIPILALTAYASEVERRRCLDVGMAACLSKPLTSQALRQALADHVPNPSPGSGPSRS